jgi:hypothetical protein
MSLIGRRPTASELTITAGLVFLISVPTVGSRFTSHTSPRIGEETLEFGNISSLPGLSFLRFYVVNVMRYQVVGMLRQYPTALVNRQLHKRKPIRQSQVRDGLDYIFFFQHYVCSLLGKCMILNNRSTSLINAV